MKAKQFIQYENTLFEITTLFMSHGIGVYTNYDGLFAIGQNNKLVSLRTALAISETRSEKPTFFTSWRIDTSKRFIFIKITEDSQEIAFWIVPNKVGGILAPEGQPDKYGADHTMTGGKHIRYKLKNTRVA